VAVAAVIVDAVVVASAEPARPRTLPDVLCVHRADRPGVSAPVHKARGGGGLMHLLPENHVVLVLRTMKGWHYVQYNDPGPQTRSEPFRFKGWIRASHVTACPPIASPVQAPVAPERLGHSQASSAAFDRQGDQREQRSHASL
jgi:hypothetical protein